MHGRLLTKKGMHQLHLGDWFIYVPAAEVKFWAGRNGANEIIVAAFPVPALQAIQGGFIPAEQALQMDFDLGQSLDVPEHIVEFAVASWKRRDADIEDASALFAELMPEMEDAMIELPVGNF